jgi:hypothetical protein
MSVRLSRSASRAAFFSSSFQGQSANPGPVGKPTHSGARTRIERFAHLACHTAFLDHNVVIFLFHYILDLGDVVPESDGEANGRGSDALVLSDTEEERFRAVEICTLAEELHISGGSPLGRGCAHSPHAKVPGFVLP